MTYEPVLFDNTMLETANEALLFCKDFLQGKGRVREASALEGLMPVHTKELGTYALEVLKNARKEIRSDDVLEYLDMAIDSICRGLETPQQELAA